MTSQEVRRDFNHVVLVLLGLRNKARCPQCGSANYSQTVEYLQGVTLYDDGYTVEDGAPDWHGTTTHCYDCCYETST